MNFAIKNKFYKQRLMNFAHIYYNIIVKINQLIFVHIYVFIYIIIDGL